MVVKMAYKILEIQVFWNFYFALLDKQFPMFQWIIMPSYSAPSWTAWQWRWRHYDPSLSRTVYAVM